MEGCRPWGCEKNEIFLAFNLLTFRHSLRFIVKYFFNYHLPLLGVTAPLRWIIIIPYFRTDSAFNTVLKGHLPFVGSFSSTRTSPFMGGFTPTPWCLLCSFYKYQSPLFLWLSVCGRCHKLGFSRWSGRNIPAFCPFRAEHLYRSSRGALCHPR